MEMIKFIGGDKYYATNLWLKIFKTDYNVKVNATQVHRVLGGLGVGRKVIDGISYYSVDDVTYHRHTGNIYERLVNVHRV